MLKQLFELPDQFVLNVRLFRVIAILGLATLLLTEFPWINNLTARVLDMPDLRHNISPLYDDNKNVTGADIYVVNMGQVKADNVLVHVHINGGIIESYSIESQELYESRQIDSEKGLIDIWLERVAPGAGIRININGRFEENDINFSATSDQGTSISSELPSFSSQVQTYSSSMLNIYDRTLLVLDSRMPSNRELLTEWENTIPGLSELISLIKSEDFKTILSAVVLLSLLITLFVPRLIWLIPFLAAFGMLIVGNFHIQANIVVILTGLIFLPSLLGYYFTNPILDEETGKFEWQPILVPISFVLFGLIMWQKEISARWLSIPVFLIAFQIMLFIAWLTPSSQSEQNVQSNDKNIEKLEKTISEQQDDLNKLQEKYDAVLKVVRMMSSTFTSQQHQREKSKEQPKETLNVEN